MFCVHWYDVGGTYKASVCVAYLVLSNGVSALSSHPVYGELPKCAPRVNLTSSTYP